ncbi:MAG: beta-ketoacyl-ACP synthase [Rhodospirillaceae bacterium]|nr:beta-ketoacyl-ACP synthase [Rhodospirillaceae bacterium]
MTDREVCITGYGLLSPLGETPAAWWAALDDPAARRARIDETATAPFPIHTIGDYDLAAQVPRPGDRRAMGPMMQYGAYAAGLALDMAGLKDDADLLQRTHMIVASGGGERDLELDRQILEGAPGRDTRGARDEWITAQMADGLRPTLFLAQLPNLFAGNISIVHKVAGSSRTFMGEEAAGADALRIAHRRLAAGQGDIFLVGAAFASERPEIQISYNAGGVLLRGGFADLWSRPNAGICFGAAGAFLVLESPESAAARGVAVRAMLRGVESDRTDRRTDDPAATARRQIERLGAGPVGPDTAVLSGASGAGAATGITAAERAMLDDLADGAPVRGTAQAVGHAVEAAFLQNVILAASCVERGEVFAPLSPDAPVEAVGAGPVSRALVTGWGHVRGEALALVEGTG